MREHFRKFASAISKAAGSSHAFIGAMLIVVGWALAGPVFNFSTTWQLFINTITTIATFLMVFLIQNTQNRDSLSMQLKLDELLQGIKGASDAYINLEDLSDEELDRLHNNFAKLRPKIDAHKRRRKTD